MGTRIATRRHQLRYRFAEGTPACVEFDDAAGRRRSFTLTDISVAGISFTIAPGDGAAALEAGSTLEGVRVRVRDCVVEGELVTMHMTAREDGGHTCGALLYPSTDADLIKLKSLITGMESAE
jgi:hypothetical protein